MPPRPTCTCRIRPHDECTGSGARGARAARALIALATLGSLVLVALAGEAAASDAVVAPLIARDLIGAPGKEVTMETVEYAPGGKSPPHSHHSQVFVYVLEGSVRMQVKGSPAATLGPGGTFYENPDDVHIVSENASQTKPAKFLVVMVKDKTPAAAAIPGPGRTGGCRVASRCQETNAATRPLPAASASSP